MENNNTNLIIIKEDNTNKYRRGIDPTNCHIEIYNNYSIDNWKVIIPNILLPVISSPKLSKLTCNDLKVFKKVIEHIYSKCLSTKSLLNLITET